MSSYRGHPRSRNTAQVLELAKGNKQFAAIDRAIGKDSFRVVLLLRLSPLLPLALSNYLYGLTSVDLVPYILGSWLGMLPGTLAYVTAGEQTQCRSCAWPPAGHLLVSNAQVQTVVLTFWCASHAVWCGYVALQTF